MKIKAFKYFPWVHFIKHVIESHFLELHSVGYKKINDIAKYSDENEHTLNTWNMSPEWQWGTFLVGER